MIAGGSATARTVAFIRNPPLPQAAKAPYSVLFAGAVASLPSSYRTKLGVPQLPFTVIKPAVSALLASLSFALGPQSPSMRNATKRVEGLQAGH